MKFTNDSNPHDKAKTKYNTHLHIPFQSLNTRHHTIITIHTSSHQPHDDHPKYQSGIQTSKSRQKSPETIKEPKERHHTKISFVKTSVPQENTPRKTQRKTPYKKIPCVVPHQLFTNNFRSSTSVHCRFPASHCQHYYHHISQENAPHIIPIKCHENNAKARNSPERQRL